MQANLNWNPVTGAVNYNVYRGTQTGGPYSKVASGVIPTSYSDTTVQPGTTYFYVVTAVNQQGDESAFSNQASVSVPAIAAPTSLTAAEQG